MARPRIGLSLPGPGNEEFTISDFLGRGAFGEVYRAAGNSSGKVIAVKLLPIGELADQTSAIALMNEVKAAAQISHPNVVQVLFVAEVHEELGPYVVMEYVSGGSLASLLRTQRLASVAIPLERTISFMVDIAQGAKAINEKLIHRDIKPDNILVDDSHLKIGDFGISKFVDEATRTKTFKGGQHFAYMAPEGWQAATNTSKLDTYSVGIVFYQIATLSHPFEKLVKDPSDWRAWERVHLFEPCPDVRDARQDIPSSIAQLIQRMAAKRYADRPEWDEVLKILTTPSAETSPKALEPSVSAAVEAALRKKRAEEAARLAAEEQDMAESRKNQLYFHSCEELIASFEPFVLAFNEQFQFGKIETHKRTGVFDQFRAVLYSVPHGRSIAVTFFERRETAIKVRGGEIIAGAHIGLDRGRSANLVLSIQGPDDLYGRWSVCEIDMNAIANPQALIGKFGISGDTVVPFGFPNASDFYDQMRYAQGVMHVFTYKFGDDVQGYFSQLLAAACE